jgi:hypothetical protein
MGVGDIVLRTGAGVRGGAHKRLSASCLRDVSLSVHQTASE